jgi:RNA polymerase sigma-70 factor (ECF subfamily)
MFEDFTAIYDLYRDSIFRYCLWKSGNRDIGEDLTQETFLRFWICLKRKDEILHTRAFLYRIAHNLFVSHIRRKKSVSLDQLQEAGFEPGIDPWQQTHNRLDAVRPMRELCKMRPSFKEVLRQRFMMGLTPAEIAMMNGETTNTISVRIFQGLKNLRLLVKNTSLRTQNAFLPLPTII